MIDFEVYDQRPSDTDLLIPAIATHEAVLGRTPRLVAADAGFYSAKNEATVAQGHGCRSQTLSLSRRASACFNKACTRSGSPSAVGNNQNAI